MVPGCRRRRALIPRLFVLFPRTSPLTLQIYYLHFPPLTIEIRSPPTRHATQMIPHQPPAVPHVDPSARLLLHVKGNRDPPQFPCDNRFFIRDIYMKVLPSFPRNNKFPPRATPTPALFARRTPRTFAPHSGPPPLPCTTMMPCHLICRLCK